LEPRAWLIRPVFAEKHANFLWLVSGRLKGFGRVSLGGGDPPGCGRSRQQKQN
jgi:hypothetical protein